VALKFHDGCTAEQYNHSTEEDDFEQGIQDGVQYSLDRRWFGPFRSSLLDFLRE
jgi:hypothetical protein